MFKKNPMNYKGMPVMCRPASCKAILSALPIMNLPRANYFVQISDNGGGQIGRIYSKSVTPKRRHKGKKKLMMYLSE